MAGAPADVDAYIAGCPPAVRPVLEQVRQAVREAAPDASEGISYRMPVFRRNGVLIYFAAFKQHIGLYPPVRGDDELDALLERYRGPKGNLKLPLDEPMPLALIQRIVRHRLAQQQAPAAGRRPRTAAR